MSYEIHITAEVNAILEKAPRRSREVIERKLRAAAQLAALRSWTDCSEATDALRIQVANLEATYSIEPQARRLVLWHVTLL
jgi:hypothetical protein